MDLPKLTLIDGKYEQYPRVVFTIPIANADHATWWPAV